MAKKKWIKGALKHPGKLHRDLGVPEGEKIPAKKMEQAKHSRNPEIRKEAALAHTLGSFHRKSSKDLQSSMYSKK